jgi:hypothetical protein
MAVYGPVRHQKNIMWTEASEVHILFFGCHLFILHFTFLFSLFVFVSAAGHYFRIWTGHYFSIWTGQVPALLF